MRTRIPGNVILAGLVSLVAFAILCGLGYWQVQRLAWKQGLVAMVEERSRQPAVPLPPEAEWPALTRDADEYRKVSLTGTFDHDREVWVFTALDDDRFEVSGPGWWILTPLVRDDGTTVIVNRGFVPDGREDPATRSEAQVPGEVTVTGLLRLPEEPGAFTPDPDGRTWYARDVPAIAEALGIARAAPFFVDADATPNPGGLPQGGATRIAFRNDHLGYAITWFGLAAALVGVYLAWAWGQVRRARALAAAPDGQ